MNKVYTDDRENWHIAHKRLKPVQFRQGYVRWCWISMRGASYQMVPADCIILNGSLIIWYGFPLQAPILSAFLYDATYLYAIGLNRTLAEGGNVTDGRAIMKNLYGRKFSSKWPRTD